MKKSSSFFMSFIPIILAIGIQFVVTIPAMCIYAFRGMSGGFQLDTFLQGIQAMPRDTAYSSLVSILYAIASIIIFGCWYRHLSKKNKKSKQLSLHPKRILSLFLLAIALQFLAEFLVQFLFYLWPSLQASYEQIVTGLGLNQMTWYAALYVVVLGPVCEELLFRGVTLHFAKNALPFWLANILQAALFGCYHMNLVQGLYAFVLGMVLGFVCYKGGSIKHAIILHIIFNVFGTFFSNLFFFNTSYGWAVWVAVGVLLVWAGLRLFIPDKY